MLPGAPRATLTHWPRTPAGVLATRCGCKAQGQGALVLPISSQPGRDPAVTHRGSDPAGGGTASVPSLNPLQLGYTKGSAPHPTPPRVGNVRAEEPP